MTDNLINDLLNLAALQQQADFTRAEITRLRALHLAALEDDLAHTNTAISEVTAAIEASAREYALSTGDFKFSEHIEVKRKPITYMYDAAEVLEAAKREGAVELVRVKEELNKVELNKGLKDGRYPWIQAEPVQDVTVSIRPLGDLLIVAKQLPLVNESEAS